MDTFAFATDQLTKAGIILLGYAQKHPWKFGISAILIIGGLFTITAPAALGFTTPGPALGSAAAAWKVSIGGVVAGSFFATLQSLTVTGTLTNVGIGMLAAGGTTFGAKLARVSRL